MKDIQKALDRARTPEPMACPECNEQLFSPMDKLSLALYDKCAMHHDEGSLEEENLFKLSNEI